MTEWAETTFVMRQVNPGEWEWEVTWHDGEHPRRVYYRAKRDDERRCDLTEGALTCCLPDGHDGPHAGLETEGLAAMPFIIEP